MTEGHIGTVQAEGEKTALYPPMLGEQRLIYI
jgi:hypothetical protein